MTQKPKVLIFIVSYNAEHFIQSVLERIHENVWLSPNYNVELLLVDDSSHDSTFHHAEDWSLAHPDYKITVLYNPENQGYGGNQKIGYHYAIENGFTAVILLHGDGQYPPEMIDDMVTPILEGEADVVFGSRMLKKSDALKGGMPLYKWIGNQILTFLQNRMLDSNLSEFHTGFRAYSCASLKGTPFEYNSNYFDFDTDIIIQMLDTNQHIKEIPIPTYYGDEISNVDGIRYGLLILITTLQSRFVQRGLFYTRKFDYSQENEVYTLKLGYMSSHQYALNHISKGMKIMDIGSGPGYMTKELHHRGASVISLDHYIQSLTREYSLRTIQSDVESYAFNEEDADADLILMLDIIEHLREPEEFLLKLRDHFGEVGTDIIITTGNIAFLPIRLGLLMGFFNYGSRGILDRDHRRLFTFASLKKSLQQTGYKITKIEGIPAPYPLAIGDNILSRSLLIINRMLIAISRSMFSYQMAFTVKPTPTLGNLLELAQKGAQKQSSQNIY